MNYMKTYAEYLEHRRYSPQTVAHYTHDLNLFKKFVDKRWSQVSKTDVSDFVEDQVKRGCKGRTVNRRLYVIKGFYEYLQEELERPVAIPVRSSHSLRSGRPLPDTLGEADITRLFTVITDHRDRAIFALMLRCGLRVAEVAA